MVEPAPAIMIHSRDHVLAAAEAARALGVPLTLISAPGAGRAAGPGWFAAQSDLLRERYPDLVMTMILDCADKAGAVLAALRRGIRRARFTGDAAAFARLAAMAEAMGAAIDGETRRVLDLAAVRDPATACGAWLSGHPRST